MFWKTPPAGIGLTLFNCGGIVIVGVQKPAYLTYLLQLEMCDEAAEVVKNDLFCQSQICLLPKFYFYLYF